MAYMRIDKDVEVRVLNGVSEQHLSELISNMLYKGYMIQNSQIEWYCGKIQGVYVFIKRRMMN